MTSGTMNICGSALVGDKLIVPSSSNPVTINMKRADVLLTGSSAREIDVNMRGGTSTLSLSGSMHGDIQVTPCSTVVLNANVYFSTLNVSGGTIEFIGNNSFSAYQTVFNDNLTGTATIRAAGGGGSGEYMEVNGAVGSGLTFDLDAHYFRDVGLQIDHPEEFNGAVGRMDFDFVAFMGL